MDSPLFLTVVGLVSTSIITWASWVSVMLMRISVSVGRYEERLDSYKERIDWLEEAVNRLQRTS
jgi:hypothetical protein